MSVPSTMVEPGKAFAKLRRLIEDQEPSDIDIIGYSVHTLVSEILPDIKRSLSHGKRVRILMLGSDSKSLFEKSALEHRGSNLDVYGFRNRTIKNTRRLIEELTEMAGVIRYQHNIHHVGLEIRFYDALPIWRGIRCGDVGLTSTYLESLSKPARDFSLRLHTEGERHSELTWMMQWFDYLWRYRSRPETCAAVVFDLYDTILTIDSGARSRAQEEMAQLLKVRTPDFVAAWERTSLASNSGTYQLTAHRFIAIMDLLGVRRDHSLANDLAILEHSMLRKNFRISYHILDFLKDLRARGYKTALVSNCSPSALEVLDESRIDGHFDVKILSFQEGVVKPDPTIYAACLDELKVEPEQCVFVGDGANNELSGALKFGMRAFRVSWARRDTAPLPKGVVSLQDFDEVGRELDSDAEWSSNYVIREG